ncbi:MAG TPA: cupin domain-containing protein, partial [Planctomycetota bacterium]|nr:cupin domain-containing protein [Planctomycetota bacterium]
AQDPKPIASGVVPWSGTPEVFPWGEMRKAFTGESFATKKLFVSSFVLKAGMEVHPPHRHAQEEFMTMVEGSGTWHLDGKEIPAKKGDVIYVAPWLKHGLKNTGETSLVYFVAQWNPKGMEAAADPEKAK